MISRRRFSTGLVSLLACAGCHQGNGSDIGPRLSSGPTYDYRLLARDDAGNPVTGAVVSVSGAAASATTGRTGRAYFREFVSGNRVITVDGANGAAVSTSLLGTLAVAATLPDGDELPWVFYLPDYASSLGLTVTTGVQAATVSLFDDDSSPNEARSGALLSIDIGDTVTHGTATSVDVRTAKLSSGHVPPTLAAGGPALLASRAIYVHPPDLDIASGASLSIPNDLGLPPAQPMTVYRLDPTVGTWVALPLPAAESGGRISAPFGSIKKGGLYCFGLAAVSTTVISGRVVDADGNGVPGALVRGPQASIRTRGDGTFDLPAMARTNAAGTDRAVTIEVDGGRRYTPDRGMVGVTLNAPAIDVGNILVEARPSTNVRLMMISRGALDKNRRIRVSGRSFLTLGDSRGGDDGVASFDDVAADVIGYLTTVPRDLGAVRRTRGNLFLSSGLLDNAASIFSDETGWRDSPTEGTLMQVVDELGTGPIFEVHGVIGDVAGQGYAGKTDFNGFLGVGIPGGGQVTMVHQTQIGGRTVTSAFSMLDPEGGRLEVPIERARRRAEGVFQRFGMFAGNLTGTAGSNTRGVRASGGTTLEDFYDQVVFGTGGGRTPSSVLPSATSVAYRIGVPAGLGHLAAVEGTTASGLFTLERLGVLLNQTVAEGVRTIADIPLSLANTAFVITNGVVGLDASMTAADFRFDLAGQLPSGLVVDLARDVGGGSITVTGSDASVILPPLTSGIARYVLGMRATKLTDLSLPTQTIIRQQTVVRLDGATAPNAPLLALPTLSSPAPGGAVSGTGFTLSYALPPTCHYAVVRLRSETATEILDWTAVVPDTSSQIKFFQFPSPAPQVFVAGRSWNLTVTAVRIDTGLLVDPRISKRETYARILSNWVGIQTAGREASAFSGVSIKITN